MTRERITASAYTAAGVVLLLVALEAVGQLGLAGQSFPAPTSVLQDAAAPATSAVLVRATGATISAAALGLIIGIAAGMLCAVVGHLTPVLRRGFDRLAVLVAALPLPALAPLFVTSFGAAGTPVVIAALGAAFGVFITMTSGLRAATATQRDLLTAFGSDRLRRLALVDGPVSIPWFLDGIALGAPAAVLGATIGEWFGAPRGLGVVVISALQNSQTSLLWAAAGIITLLSLVGYLIPVLLRGVAVRRFGA